MPQPQPVLTIPLANGKGVMLVDPEDFIRVSQHKWWLHNKRYAATNIDSKNVYAHRFILNLGPDDPEVDHINHDGLDNRRSNLRVIPHGLNVVNTKHRTGGTSRFKGVSYETQYAEFAKPWKAKIQIDGKGRHLGYFTDEDEAAQAYDRAAVEAWGEHAYTNDKVGLYETRAGR